MNKIIGLATICNTNNHAIATNNIFKKALSSLIMYLIQKRVKGQIK